MASPQTSYSDDISSEVTSDSYSCATSSICRSRAAASSPPMSLADSLADTDMSRFTEDEDEPRGLDATPPMKPTLPAQSHHNRGFSLERNAFRLLSTDHLDAIVRDPTFLARFTTYLNTHTAHGAHTLREYLARRDGPRSPPHDSIAETSGRSSRVSPILIARPGEGERASTPSGSHGAAEPAVDLISREYLPGYVAHIFHAANTALHHDILAQFRAEQLANRHRLAAMFCLTDPVEAGGGIAFASKDYCRTIQHPLATIVGRNPSFLQGPMTDVRAMGRLARAVRDRDWHTELLVNYRKDGAPFLNLLTVGPLNDDQGQLRYWLGAQMDVTSSFDKHWEQHISPPAADSAQNWSQATGDAAPVRARSRPSKTSLLSVPTGITALRRSSLPRPSLRSTSSSSDSLDERRPVTALLPSIELERENSRASSVHGSRSISTAYSVRSTDLGIYQKFLVLRPQSPFRVLFASPELVSRASALIQTPFLSHIGGDAPMIGEFESALSRGHKVTARIQWSIDARAVPSAGEEAVEEPVASHECWAHCTPLMGPEDKVGAWVVLLLHEGPATGSSAPG